MPVMLDYNLKTWERTTDLLRQSESIWQDLLLKELGDEDGVL